MFLTGAASHEAAAKNQQLEKPVSMPVQGSHVPRQRRALLMEQVEQLRVDREQLSAQNHEVYRLMESQALRGPLLQVNYSASKGINLQRKPCMTTMCILHSSNKCSRCEHM